MKKREQALQIMISERDGCSSMGLLIETLRYAELLTVVSERTDSNDNTFYMIQIRSPKGWINQQWINANEERIRSFGLNVACVYV